MIARGWLVAYRLALLRDQQARKVDVVASASSVRAEGGCLVLDKTMPLLGADGVTMTEGCYRPTDVCDAGIADKHPQPETLEAVYHQGQVSPERGRGLANVPDGAVPQLEQVLGAQTAGQRGVKVGERQPGGIVGRADQDRRALE